MKKEVIALSFFVLLLILIFPLVIAAEADQVSKAYECLENKIDSANCSNLSPDEKVFSLMAVEKCQSELLETSYNNTCWPKENCKVLETAKAGFALSTVGINITENKNWLLTKTKPATEVEWFLEIEADGLSSCFISYGDSYGTIQILENKKISESAGNCLPLSENGYWFKINPSCYGTEFKISCDKRFLTTLLFKKSDSSTIHVSEDVTSPSAGGTSTEQVISYCFADGDKCDYKSSLWATYTLYSLGYDVKPYLPYLITMREENEYLLPEAFLKFITGEYQEELFSYQIANTYWQKSGDKYYDTALAMWPFHYAQPYAWEKGRDWLLEEQEADGCWDSGNLQNTAFILYSVWPEYFSGRSECFADDDCPGDEICEDGLCIEIPECSIDDDCSGDQICEEGICIDLPECEIDDDCEEGEVCTDGVCVEGDECTSDDDCSGDQICEDGYCVEPPECTIDDDCEDDEICDDDGYCIYYIPDEPTPCDDKYDCNSNQECLDNECVDNEILKCEDEGYFCMSAIDCDGYILDSYSDSCFMPFKCCTVEKKLDSCSEQNGEICASDEYCSGGKEVDASDIYSDELCCVGGFCKKSSGGSGGGNEDDCESNNGVCRTSCLSDEAESSFYDCSYGDVCCMPAKKESTGGRILIWILLALILIAVIGIVFRDKLRTLWMKLKSKFKKGKNKKPEFFPSIMHPQPTSGRPIPRRILPSKPLSARRPAPGKPEPKHKGELDDILKKLKDIGK